MDGVYLCLSEFLREQHDYKDMYNRAIFENKDTIRWIRGKDVIVYTKILGVKGILSNF